MSAPSPTSLPEGSRGGPIIVKIGGAAGVDLENVCNDVAELVRQGERVVVVNGGSEAGERLLKLHALDRPEVSTLSGNVVRLTNAVTLRVLMMAWVGEVNKRVVLALGERGLSAVGLCGADGRVLIAKRRPPLKVNDGGRIRIDREHLSGEIQSVNTRLLGSLMEQDHVPVVCPPAMTEEGVLVNADADQVAASIAIALGARAFVMLSNVPGLLENPNEPLTLVRHSDDVEGCMQLAAGRMRYKLDAARKALQGGVPSVYVSSSRVPRPVFVALTEESGTRFTLPRKDTANALT